jgi:hypothetical protein
MDRLAGPSRDPRAEPRRELACGGCGWSGPASLLRGAGLAPPSGPGQPVVADDDGDPEEGPALGDPLALGCPRCGSPMPPDPPSVATILAARRAPES